MKKTDVPEIHSNADLDRILREGRAAARAKAKKQEGYVKEHNGNGNGDARVAPTGAVAMATATPAGDAGLASEASPPQHQQFFSYAPRPPQVGISTNADDILPDPEPELPLPGGTVPSPTSMLDKNGQPLKGIAAQRAFFKGAQTNKDLDAMLGDVRIIRIGHVEKGVTRPLGDYSVADVRRAGSGDAFVKLHLVEDNGPGQYPIEVVLGNGQVQRRRPVFIPDTAPEAQAYLRKQATSNSPNPADVYASAHKAGQESMSDVLRTLVALREHDGNSKGGPDLASLLALQQLQQRPDPTLAFEVKLAPVMEEIRRLTEKVANPPLPPPLPPPPAAPDPRWEVVLRMIETTMPRIVERVLAPPPTPPPKTSALDEIKGWLPAVTPALGAVFGMVKSWLDEGRKRDEEFKRQVLELTKMVSEQGKLSIEQLGDKIEQIQEIKERLTPEGSGGGAGEMLKAAADLVTALRGGGGPPASGNRALGAPPEDEEEGGSEPRPFPRSVPASAQLPLANLANATDLPTMFGALHSVIVALAADKAWEPVLKHGLSAVQTGGSANLMALFNGMLAHLVQLGAFPADALPRVRKTLEDNVDVAMSMIRPTS